MIDIKELKAEFVRNSVNQEDVAKFLGINKKTLSLKLKKGVFGTDEAEMLIRLLNINDPAKIFFAKEVTYKDTNQNNNK